MATTNKKEKFVEPDVKWAKSKARKLLVKDILDGKVPLMARDESGKSTMKLSKIYCMWDEYKLYDKSKFLS